MTQESGVTKVITIASATLGALSDKLDILIQSRIYLSSYIAWMDSVYVHTALLALIGGMCGYIGTKIVEGVHNWWKNR